MSLERSASNMTSCLVSVFAIGAIVTSMLLCAYVLAWLLCPGHGHGVPR